MFDVIIIGAGVTGSAIARELSRYSLSIAVLERNEDVCTGTSKANSGIVHAGYDAKEGSLMAKLNVEGNAMMEQWARELNFPFQRIGSFVVCTDPSSKEGIQTLYQRGIANGVKGLRIVEQEELRQMEPNIASEAIQALYAPTAGIVCPFELNLAMAENACENGVQFFFDTEVISIESKQEGYRLKTNRGLFDSKIVINAAGVYADIIHNMVCEEKLQIYPRKGEYYLLDKNIGKHVSHVIFQLPTKMGKGVLVTPTVHGNLLVGPTNLDVEDKEGVQTTEEGLKLIAQKASLAIKDIPLQDVITSFAGLRAHLQEHDFYIKESKPDFIDAAGIESPGLTACPAIGKMIGEYIQEKYKLEPRENFNPIRTGRIDPSRMDIETRNALIRQDPSYGKIVCRCEMISEGEIRDALQSTLPAHSLDGIKRRTRAGMGRCQSGFCMPRTMEFLNNPTKTGGHSHLITGKIKEDL